LAGYLDGNLAATRRPDIETHVAGCTRCKTEMEQIELGMAIVRELPLVQAPDHVWAAIESALDQPATGHPFRIQRWRLAAAAAVVALLAMIAVWYSGRPVGEQWEVVRLAGSPSIESEPFAEKASIRSGELIETDRSSRARIQVGQIGSVDVEPNTQVAIVTANPQEHRLALRSGEISARILAPPRLFFVDTPSGTAIDLGCEYTLRCDRSGTGVLRVERGWVSFEYEGRESLVPAGATCRTRPGIGPGTPYFEDAPGVLVQALDVLDSQSGSVEALNVVLAESRARDTLTLWHLLSRVDPRDRFRVYERMAALSPPPDDVSREQLLALDPESLTRWREELAWTW
jgi:hypothetical protein